MVVRKRNKTIEKDDNLVEEEIDNNFPSTKFDNIIIKTWKEEAIEVLNILEKQGINIYDHTNYGGMYLKRKISGEKNNEIKQIFKNPELIDNKENQNLNNLFNFFNNNNNGRKK
jgi:hypothetical protein